MPRPECGYCEVDDVKNRPGEQWTSGVKWDTLLEDFILSASRLIDRELGWRDCHCAASDQLASARYYDCVGGSEMWIDRCLDTASYTGTLTFVALTKQITAASGLDVFQTGETIVVVGSALNDGTYTIATGRVAGVIVVVEALVNEGPTAGVTITAPASLLVAVDEKANGVYVAWTANTDYIIWPYDEGWLAKLIIKTGATKVFPVGQRLLRVTAKWGAHIRPPQIIKEACAITVFRWLKRAQQMYQDTGAIVELGQLTYTKALDPDVQEILRVTARRVAIG